MREIIDLEQGLREQHKEFIKMNYDGHNRRSRIITMHDLSVKRSRRTWRMRMRIAVCDINSRLA